MNSIITIVSLIFTISSPVFSGSVTDFEDRGGYPNGHLLITTEEAAQLLYNEQYVFVDMRASGYDEGHIPGAAWFGGPPALVDTSHTYEHFLVGPKAFQSMMRSAGINNDSKIIIYDQGNSLASARLFFALELYGHQHIQILNGGMQAWKESGFETERSGEIPVPGNFTVAMDESRTCDVGFMIEAINNENIVILDARTPEEYSGEREMASRSGHIPNAVNLEWVNFMMEDGIPYFKPAEEIAAMLAERGITPDKQVVTHCHTNVRGSHAYFTLRLMGYDSVKAYEGSWSEWGNREDTPIAQ